MMDENKEQHMNIPKVFWTVTGNETQDGINRQIAESAARSFIVMRSPIIADILARRADLPCLSVETQEG